MRDAHHDKFYQIEQPDTRVQVCYGRIGTAGTTYQNEFPSPDAAFRIAMKIVREKIQKGYRLPTSQEESLILSSIASGKSKTPKEKKSSKEKKLPNLIPLIGRY